MTHDLLTLVSSLQDNFRSLHLIHTRPSFLIIHLYPVSVSGVCLCELPQHRLLVTEGGQRDASENPDRHIQLQQQLQQQTHSPSVH